jgi:hypothetical protein
MWTDLQAHFGQQPIRQSYRLKSHRPIPDRSGAHRMTFQAAQEATFTNTFKRLEKLYDDHLSTHRDLPQATQQADRLIQGKRMRVLCHVTDLSQAKILGFGCGTDRLLGFMKQECD